MVTRDILCLTIAILLNVVLENNFQLLSLDCCLLLVVRGSSKNTLTNTEIHICCQIGTTPVDHTIF